MLPYSRRLLACHPYLVTMVIPKPTTLECLPRTLLLFILPFLSDAFPLCIHEIMVPGLLLLPHH